MELEDEEQVSRREEFRGLGLHDVGGLRLGQAACSTAPAVLQVPAATRVAGNTSSGYNGDYGSAINLDLNGPIATVFDAAGISTFPILKITASAR